MRRTKLARAVDAALHPRKPIPESEPYAVATNRYVASLAADFRALIEGLQG